MIVEDALGNDLYRVNTGGDGFTPWIALPSNFHLDFRGLGGGDNPDGFADDDHELAQDGIDNDGDLTIGQVQLRYSAVPGNYPLYRYTTS